MENDELMHYGVLGMKWGKRKATYTSLGNKYHSRAARNIQKDADNLRKHGYKNEAKAVQKVADKHRTKAQISQEKYQAKKDNKRDIEKAYNKIRYDESLKGRMRYDKATYRLAAKNMVNKGMDQKTAVSKAKASAWRNVELYVAGRIAYDNRDKVINSIKKYANTKTMQRTNRNLARIGTMKLKHVGKNVYEYRMG